MEKLKQLLDTYPTSKPSKSNYLDARYFNAMFKGYGGLVEEPLVLRITLAERVSDEMKWKMPFDIRQLPEVPLHMMLSDETPDILRVVIEVQKRGRKNLKSRHSNLLIFDPNEKKVVRFEPMTNPQYSEIVDQFLRKYLEKNAPEYKLVHATAHPQMMIEQYCPDRGFCAAYVMKFACMYVLPDKTVSFTKDPLDILKFAHAVKMMYKPEMLAMYGQVITKDEETHMSIAGEPDIEYGTTGAVVGGVVGGVVGSIFGPVGTLVGVGVGAAAGAGSGNTHTTRYEYR